MRADDGFVDGMREAEVIGIDDQAANDGLEPLSGIIATDFRNFPVLAFRK